MKPLSYRDQTVIITGASSGLGVEFAERLAARGADVILVARREDRLRDLADRIASRHGTRAEVIAMDLLHPGAGTDHPDQSAGEALSREISARGLVPTALINNAGFGASGALHQVDPDRTMDMVRLNVDVLTDLTQTFLPALRAADAGFLINLASIAAYQPNPGLAVYGATKAYVLSLTEALWEESRSAGLRVLALSPGPTKTEFFDIAGDAAAAGLPRMEPGAVVECALRALERRDPPASVVPGALNTLTAVATRRLLPRRVVLPAVGSMMRRGLRR